MLYVLRHGTTSANEPGQERIRGWSQIGLSDEGRKAVHDSAQVLKGRGITQIISSDLPRAAETASIVRQYLQAPVRLDHGLRPWDLGVWTGALVSEAAPVMEKYVRDRFTAVPGGEAWNQFLARWDSMLTYVLRTVREKRTSWVLVGHARLLYTLDYLLSAGDAPIPTGGVYPPGTILVVDPKRPGLGPETVYEPPSNEAPRTGGLS